VASIQTLSNDSCKCAVKVNHHSDQLRHAIDHAAHLLPAQGPITVFIHHNTLHAFEQKSFHEAVQDGGKIFGCEPYLSETRYRAELARGRIRFDDLEAVLSEELGERARDSLVGLATRLELRLTMLAHSVWTGTVSELEWIIAETDALRRVRPGVSESAHRRLVNETRRWVMRDLRGGRGQAIRWVGSLFRKFPVKMIESWDADRWEAFTLEALWRVCLEGVRGTPAPPEPPQELLRHRDLLLRVTSVDVDELVNEVLIRFCPASLDQGMSHWQLPERKEGMFRSFLLLYAQAGGPPDRWLRDLRIEAERLLRDRTTPLDCIAESLQILGVAEEEWGEYLSETFLALRGWGGMVLQVAQRGDRVEFPIPLDSLHEFLAIRLLLDRLALVHVAREELGFRGSLNTLRSELKRRIPAPVPLSPEQRAFPLFQLAQDLGWSPEELNRLTAGEWALLTNECESFCPVTRRRVFHLAYERRFRIQSLDAVALHPRYRTDPNKRPRFQTMNCLDEREESFRRHLEEIAPDVETFAAAGFYNVAMYYRGTADAYFVPLCPIVLTPRHWVREQVCDGYEHAHQWQERTRRTLGGALHHFRIGTRSFVLGALLSAGLGVLASIPLIAAVLLPRLSARIRRMFGRVVTPTALTKLRLERTEAVPGPENGRLGYSIEEMATVSGRLLRDVGLIRRFARLVFILGHGSDSLNNPHKSAYDCGACGGSPGAPNGRALAQMLNEPRVRAILAQQGIAIPEDTWFIGGVHNTCDDSVSLADLERVPETHRSELARIQAEFEEVCNRNAHERCRRFMSAPLDMTFPEARRHVEARSEDLAQTRPELGHATNALCIVTRRERTRGLYLDRRAFLTDYNPTQDDAQGSTLGRLLGAAVPVCAGINLEYYFSHVDNAGYGCGTKLPHNPTSLLGVMDGAASDLRTGLPWQMVEIHEPVRLLFIIETTPETFLTVMNSSPVISLHVLNEWVQVALLDPESNKIVLWQDGEFRPYEPEAASLPTARTSADWYRGWRDHLEFAELTDHAGVS